MSKYEIRYYNHIAQEEQSVFIEAESAERAQELFVMRYGYDQDLLNRTYDYYPPVFETEESILQYLNYIKAEEADWQKELNKLSTAKAKEAAYRQKMIAKMQK